MYILVEGSIWIYIKSREGVYQNFYIKGRSQFLLKS